METYFLFKWKRPHNVGPSFEMIREVYNLNFVTITTEAFNTDDHYSVLCCRMQRFQQDNAVAHAVRAILAFPQHVTSKGTKFFIFCTLQDLTFPDAYLWGLQKREFFMITYKQNLQNL
jgi:hypothetical protein